MALINYFIGRGLVRHFHTRSVCIRNRTSERSITNSCENPVRAPCPWSNLYVPNTCNLISGNFLTINEVNENFSLTVVIENQVQRAYSISVSLAIMYIKLSLCIERIIIINSDLCKKGECFRSRQACSPVDD